MASVFHHESGRSTKQLNLWLRDNLAFDTEIVGIPCHRAIRMDSEMNILVYQEVVAGPLANDLEIVYKRELEAYLAIEGFLRHARPLVLFARGQADAAHSLWLEVDLAMEPALAVKRGVEEEVKCPAQFNQLSHPVIGAGDKHYQVERFPKAIGDCCAFRQGGRYSQYPRHAERDGQ